MKIIVYVIIVVAVLGAAVLFSVQNAEPAKVSFYNWQFTASVAIVVFLSIVAGAVITALSFLTAQFTRSIRRRGRAKAQNQKEETPSPPDTGRKETE